MRWNLADRVVLGRIALLSALFVPGTVLADAAPDLEVNPVTGKIEAIAVSAEAGGRVLHIEDGGWTDPAVATVVSTEPAAQSRLAIKETGETWAVWEDVATGQVRYAVRNPDTKAWAQERILSRPGEVGRSPRIVHAGAATWIAYEARVGASSVVAVSGIIDSPEPFPPTGIAVVLGASILGINLDLQAEQGRVWVTWLDGPLFVGWSAYDPGSGTWSPPVVRSLLGTSVGAARDRIRSEVLGH